MISVSASAPGKIVLCGEYVVLDGAPALGVALNRRASVTICENQAGRHSVISPGYADQEFSFQVDGQSDFQWWSDASPLQQSRSDLRRNHPGMSSVPDFSLLEQIWRSFAPGPSTTLDLVLDTRPFVDSTDGHKLGLGSSAALTVALSAAMARLQQRAADLDAMIASHCRFQNGHGSGIDIAVAQCGGVVEYRRGNAAIVQHRGGGVEDGRATTAVVTPRGGFLEDGRGDATYIRHLTWPSGLEYAILWSGTATCTAQQLERLGASASHSDSRDRLAVASEKIVKAWPQAEAAQMMGLFADYTAALRAFSVAHDLGIFDAGHGELVKVADKHGAVYKPCGAGGGDAGVVLSTDTSSISTFVAEAVAMGFKPLDLSIDDVGLTLGQQEK